MAQPRDDQFSCRALRGWSCLFLMKFLVAGETIWQYMQVLLRIIPNREKYVVETIVKPWFQHVSTTEQMFIPYSTEITLATAAGAAAAAGAWLKKEAAWTDPMETEVPWNSLHFGYEITTVHHVLLITMLLYHAEINNWNSETLPSGKQPHNYGKQHFLMGKLTINGNFQ